MENINNEELQKNDLKEVYESTLNHFMGIQYDGLEFNPNWKFQDKLINETTSFADSYQSAINNANSYLKSLKSIYEKNNNYQENSDFSYTLDDINNLLNEIEKDRFREKDVELLDDDLEDKKDISPLIVNFQDFISKTNQEGVQVEEEVDLPLRKMGFSGYQILTLVSIIATISILGIAIFTNILK